MVVKNGPKPSIGDESTLALVFVLEEWLDQKSAMLHICSDSDHEGLQLLLLAGVKDRFWIQDRWGRVGGKSGSWVLLEALVGEDSLDFLIEIEVPNLIWVLRASEEVLEQLVLLGGQLYLLSVEGSSEFGGINSSLSERIVVLKELTNSDPVSLNHIHDLDHESIDGLGSSEVDIEWLIGRLGSSVWLVDDVLEASAVIQEWQVLDVSKLVSVGLHDRGELFIRDGNSQKSDGLLELLWRHLEVVVSILILEETLGVQSLPVDQEHELLLNRCNVLLVSAIWSLLAIE